jgi:DNA polymerase-3 subunit alpha (Gram-positive type)
MTEKLKAYFERINLFLDDDEQKYFANAAIENNIEYSNKNNKLRIFIAVDNFLPIHILYKIETAMTGNSFLPSKLNIIVRQHNVVDKELLWNYLEYIKTNKAEVISTGASLIQYDYVTYDATKKNFKYCRCKRNGKQNVAWTLRVLRKQIKKIWVPWDYN